MIFISSPQQGDEPTPLPGNPLPLPSYINPVDQIGSELETLELYTLYPDRLICISNVDTFNFLPIRLLKYHYQI